MKKLIIISALLLHFPLLSQNSEIQISNGFVENIGQVKNQYGTRREDIDFKFKSSMADIYIHSTGFHYQFMKPMNENSHSNNGRNEIIANYEIYRVDVNLEGANPNPVIEKTLINGYKENYMLTEHEYTSAYSYDEIKYVDIYPNIDWVIKQTKNGLKYDFVVHPGGEPDDISLRISGCSESKIDELGRMILISPFGEIIENAPLSFTESGLVESSFRLDNSRLKFNIGEYDESEILTIDPTLSWSTYYGSSQTQYTEKCSTDQNGNIVYTGFTTGNNIATVGAHQVSIGGLYDAFLVKFNNIGTLQWCTYIGGANDDFGYDVAVDASNQIYVTGETESSSGIATIGAHQTVLGGAPAVADAFLAKFDTNGNIIWSTYYGTSSAEQGGKSINIDNNGDLTIVGTRYNAIFTNSTSFIAKFTAAGIFTWEQSISGDAWTRGHAVCNDSDNNYYLVGTSKSTINISTLGTYQQVYAGAGGSTVAGDAYIIKFSNSGDKIWGTYFGGPAYDWAGDAIIDNNDSLYIVGWTSSLSGISNGNAHQPNNGASYDGFIAKFDTTGNIAWSTYYGGNDIDLVTGVTINLSNDLYISGKSRSTNNIATLDGHQTLLSGSNDAFLAKFSPNGDRVWGTYYGGAAGEGQTNLSYGGIYYQNPSVDAKFSDNIFLVGYSGSTGIATAGAYQISNNGGDSFIAKFRDCQNSGTDVQTACNTFDWIDGNTYTADNNTATWTEMNAAGCDSVVTLDLTINYSNTGVDVQTACNTFDWIDGNTYTASNNSATWTETNAAGCDSIVTLDLTVNYSNTGTDVQTACNTFDWIDGNTYTTSNNTATWTETNAAGCDSIVTLDLTVNYSNTGTDVQTACNTFDWIDGNTYTADNNTATWTETNAAGCDSIVTLDLTINYSNTGTDVQTACNTFDWIDGNTYTASNNTATWTETNVAGCDSIVTLDLTINYSNTGTDVQTACNTFDWIDGNTYTVSNNTATWTETNAAGCDSIVTLDLTINYSNTGTDVQTACNTFDWIDGNTYTSSNNTATWTETNVAGCDSIVTLDLTINYSNTGTDVQTACNTFDWIDGNTYTASNNTATWLETNAAGCDSIITLDLTINYSNTGTDVQAACNTFDWIDGNTYTTSNNTATWTETNAAGCDSIVTLDLTINPLPDNNVTQSGSLLTADQAGATYQWLDCNDNDATINGETNQSYTPTPITGDYAVEVTLNGCVDTSACLLVDYTGLSDLYVDILSLYPNPTSDVLTISGLNEVNGLSKMEITSTTGKVVMIIEELKEELDVSELPTGVYFLNIVHQKGIETIRFVKQ